MSDKDSIIEQKYLQQFLDELEKTRFEIRKSAVLSKASGKYVRNLENLIKISKNLLSDTGTKTDSKKFEKLVRDTDFSLKVLQKKNRKDELFQKEFTEIFGELSETQDYSNNILTKLSGSLKKLTSAVDVINNQTTKDVGGTASDFLVGPFGKIVFDTIKDAKESSGRLMEKIQSTGIIEKTMTDDFFTSKLNLISKPKDVGTDSNNIKGQAHDGMTNVPTEGSYILDKQERVISPDQNTDLTSFLDDMASRKEDTKKTVDVFVVGHDARYFDSIIDNDDRITIEEESSRKKQHKEIKTKFEILNDVVSRMGGSFFANLVIGFSIWYKRFQRHPILNTMGILMTGISRLMKGFSGLFGITSLLKGIGKFLFGDKAKTDTDRIVRSNEDIVDAILKGRLEDRRGFFEKIKDTIVGKAKGAVSRFSTKDKTDVMIEVMENIAKGVWSHVTISDEMKEELKKSKKSGMGLLGLFGKKLGAAGMMLGSSAKMIFKSFGASLMITAAKFGPKIFSLAGIKILALIGAAFGAGNLIGKYIVTPILESIDSVFQTNIMGFIGRMMVKLVSTLEQLPVIGGLFRKITGGDATNILKMEEESKGYSKKIIEIQEKNVEDQIKVGQVSPTKREELFNNIRQGNYNIAPIDKTSIKVKEITSRLSDVASEATKAVNGVVNNIVNNNTRVETKPRADIENYPIRMAIEGT